MVSLEKPQARQDEGITVFKDAPILPVESGGIQVGSHLGSLPGAWRPAAWRDQTRPAQIPAQATRPAAEQQPAPAGWLRKALGVSPPCHNLNRMLWALGLLALLQSVLSLLSARRWLSFIHRYRAGAGFPLPSRETGHADAAQSGTPHSPLPTQDETPPLSLIVPCRGYETGLEDNLAAYGQQDYPDYELIFATSGPKIGHRRRPAPSLAPGSSTPHLSWTRGKR